MLPGPTIPPCRLAEDRRGARCIRRPGLIAGRLRSKLGTKKLPKKNNRALPESGAGAGADRTRLTR
eukprot:156495-Hanusia_phi.AAC.1